MEGLIKGLINVALDHVQGGGGGDRDDDTRRDRDEQPRSSWSQVVSGEQDEGYTDSSSRPQESYGKSEEWESGGSRPSRRPIAASHEDGDSNNDGWETVGQKKPSKKHHKVSLEL